MKTITRIDNRFVMKLASVGNPDYGQYAPLSEPQTVICDTLEQCAQEARAYIETWDLGGGNWPRTFISQNGRRVARVSYNGRVWDAADERKELCAS